MITTMTKVKPNERIGHRPVKKTPYISVNTQYEPHNVGVSSTTFSFRNTDFSCLSFTGKYFKTSMRGLCYTCGPAEHYSIDYFVSLSLW